MYCVSNHRFKTILTMLKKQMLFLSSFFLLWCCTSENEVLETNEVNQPDYKIIAYVNEWKNNWGNDFEKAKQITHINYAFANIKNGEVIEGSDSDTETLRKLNALKQVNPNLKILISVGGWTWSGNFSDAVLTEESRQVFANSAIAFLQKHKIDGIDLDWEYPGQIGNGNVHRPEDKENFTAILKLLREKLDAIVTEGQHYLLTIASAANQAYLDHTNMGEAQQYLDFINIMTYDFHGGWVAKTGHHANLYTSKHDDNSIPRSAAIAVQQHLNAGIPAEKIVLGVPFYGRWWQGVKDENNGLYQPSTGVSGSYNYHFIVDSLVDKNGFQAQWDSMAKVPYLWRIEDAQFVTYDNAKSMHYKASFVKDKELGGIMFWQFNGDNGTLLQTIFDVLNDNPN